MASHDVKIIRLVYDPILAVSNHIGLGNTGLPTAIADPPASEVGYLQGSLPVSYFPPILALLPP